MIESLRVLAVNRSNRFGQLSGNQSLNPPASKQAQKKLQWEEVTKERPVVKSGEALTVNPVRGR